MTTIIQALQAKSISLLETIVTTLEQYDDAEKRPKYFSKRCAHKGGPKDADHSSEGEREVDEDDQQYSDGETEAPAERFKHLGLELLDIGLHQGNKCLDFVK